MLEVIEYIEIPTVPLLEVMNMGGDCFMIGYLVTEFNVKHLRYYLN